MARVAVRDMVGTIDSHSVQGYVYLFVTGSVIDDVSTVFISKQGTISWFSPVYVSAIGTVVLVSDDCGLADRTVIHGTKQPVEVG